MANIQCRIIAEIDPSKPVQEICGVITAVMAYHPDAEAKVLKDIRNALDKRIEELQPKPMVEN
jgi:hypothetical protein